MIDILLLEVVNKSYLAEDELQGHRLTSINISNIATESKIDEAINSFIEDKFETIIGSQLIVIDNLDSEVGFRFIYHFRFVYLKIPIFIICELSEKEIFEKYRYLSTKGSKIVSKDELNLVLSNGDTVPNLEQELDALFKDEESFRAGFLDKLTLKAPEQQGRHSIANQWGAYRMAELIGLNKVKYEFPKTLYFKNLIAISKSVKPVDNLQFPIVKNILLIDDNFNKGWSACLKSIFGSEKVEAYKSWSDAISEGVKEKIIEDRYDLIFLDYYLDEGESVDRVGKGKEILKETKGRVVGNEITYEGLNPVVPVIIFTASNKAWNMDELYESGADGYYVKEHPETAHDAEFSTRNFENFYETVKKCLEKGKLLGKYWKQIKNIEKDLIIENKLSAYGKLEFEKGRISERLMMFLGLLKKESEQTKFDKSTFFYSEWELAFLTLWSVLNEIQEAYYEKTNKFVPFSFKDISGNIKFQNSHIGKSKYNFPNSISWKIVNTHDYFIAYLPEFDINQQPKTVNSNYFSVVRKSKIFLDDRQISGYKLHEEFIDLDKKYKYEKYLFIQIAYLIFKIPSDENIDRDRLNKNLLYLNHNLRNELYLTHGEETSSTNFRYEYKSSRKSKDFWEKHIEQLFEIVYFLCTGRECTWDDPK